MQNRLYSCRDEAVNCSTADIKLVQDEETGLVYNFAFNGKAIIYDSYYNNEQSKSSTFLEHLNNVACIVSKNVGHTGLIEVGCGKGFFLELLLSKGIEITGFDATYEGKNHLITKRNFQPGIIKKPAKGLILRHVLEHIQDPFGFLETLRDANGGEGLIYIEVPCFDWIIKNHAWYDIFHEHVNYFRMIDFQQMFSNLLYANYSFDNQYISVVGDLSSLRKPKLSQNSTIKLPEEFSSVELMFNRYKFTSSPVIWGGGSKGIIFAHLLKQLKIDFNAIIDINPDKQGKFTPVTGFEIQPPEILRNYPPKTNIITMNPNYIKEVKEMTDFKFNYQIVA